jgi:hypothetical protein
VSYILVDIGYGFQWRIHKGAGAQVFLIPTEKLSKLPILLLCQFYFYFYYYYYYFLWPLQHTLCSGAKQGIKEM